MASLGHTFVSKIQQLKIKNAENLDSSSIDWVFMPGENAPLKNFVEWFCDNVSSADVLSEEELLQYADLEEAGEVLEGQQLENLAHCLNGIENISWNETNGLDDIALNCDTKEDDDGLDEEMEKLEEQIQKVNDKRSQLSLQNIKVSGRLSELNTELSRQQTRFLQNHSTTLSASSDLKEIFNKLTQLSQQIATLLKRIPMPEAGYLLSTDLANLREEEQNHTQALKHYIRKQFPQVSLSTSIFNDKLTLLEEDELSLVKSIEPDTHLKQSAELKRLSKLILDNELRFVSETAKDARLKSEIDKATLVLERIKRGYYRELSETSLEQEIQSCQLQQRIASEEVCRLEKTVNDLVKGISDQHTTATLVSDATIKLARHKYYSEKQHLLLTALVDQLSRQNLLCILLQCEAEKVKLSIDVIGDVQALLEEHTKQTTSRLEHLQGLCDNCEEERGLETLQPHLSTLTNLLQEGEEEETVNSTVSLAINAVPGVHRRNQAVEKLSAVLERRDESQHYLASQYHPYSYRLNKLLGKCELLQECLSGEGSKHLPGVLPNSWLPADLIDKQNDVETASVDLQKSLMALFTEYEIKKKMAASQLEA